MDDDVRAALWEATRGGDAAALRALLKSERARALVAERVGGSLLMDAVEADAPGCVEALGEAGATCERDSWSPLHAAAESGRVACAEALLRGGARVDACGEAGWTPLHEAAKAAQLECAELLLRAGARVDAGLRDWYRGTRVWYLPGATAEDVASGYAMWRLLRRARRDAALLALAAAATRGELFDRRLFDAALWRVVWRFAA
jgi:ankyrin repeat protein